MRNIHCQRPFLRPSSRPQSTASAPMPANLTRDLNRRQQEVAFWALLNPSKTQRELARDLGYSESWLSSLMSSDMFQDHYRKLQETYHSTAFLSIKSKTETAATLAINRLTDILENDRENVASPGYILEAAVKLLERLEKMSAAEAGPAQHPGMAINITLAQEIHTALDQVRRVQSHVAPIEHQPESGNGADASPEDQQEDTVFEPV